MKVARTGENFTLDQLSSQDVAVIYRALHSNLKLREELLDKLSQVVTYKDIKSIGGLTIEDYLEHWVGDANLNRRTHCLKCPTHRFDAIANGYPWYEIQMDIEPNFFRTGDLVILNEWGWDGAETADSYSGNRYTGESVTRIISRALSHFDFNGIAYDTVILHLSQLG